MPDCDYCGASFDGEEQLNDHLGSAHEQDELSRIDQRRANSPTPGLLTSVGVAPIALVAVLGAVVGLLAVSAFLGGDSGADATVEGVEQTPSDLGSRHYHGTIAVIVDGEQIDFSASQYQVQSDYVHFEGGDGTKWHVHSRGATLGYFMATLGIDISNDAYVNQNTGTEVTGSDSVTVRVDGERVEPETYVLQPEDSVRIVVETE